MPGQPFATKADVPILRLAIQRFYRDEGSNVSMGSHGADFHIPKNPFTLSAHEPVSRNERGDVRHIPACSVVILSKGCYFRPYWKKMDDPSFRLIVKK